MANIERDLREIGRAVRNNINRITEITLRVYTLHDLDQDSSRSAMHYVESLEGIERDDAQRAYTNTWRRSRSYKIRNLVTDAIDVAKKVVSISRKP